MQPSPLNFDEKYQLSVQDQPHLYITESQPVLKQIQHIL